jgi:hypothetical protein
MPTLPRHDYELIDLFLSAYEQDSWKGCKKDWLETKQDRAIELLATRSSDNATLAIEHTLIEPFVGEKEDFVQFSPLLEIEKDQSLTIPGHAIYVDVPVGALRKKSRPRKLSPNLIVVGVQDWLKANLRSLPLGRSQHTCHIQATDGSVSVVLPLKTRVVPLRQGKARLLVRRWVGDWNCGDCVEKALRNKLPKLVNTKASKRILLLERDNMRLSEDMILEEIKKRKATFPELAKVNEIWLAETLAYETEKIVYFWLHDANHQLTSSLGFDNGHLIERCEGGVSTL